MGEESTNTSNSVDYEALRLSLYMTMKTLYERWIVCYTKEDFTLKSPRDEYVERMQRQVGAKNGVARGLAKSEFSNFAYLDSFYNDIGTKLMFNPEHLYHTIIDHSMSKANHTVYQVMSNLASKNNCMFITFPLFTNIYDVDRMVGMFTPSTKNRREFHPVQATFIVMYTYRNSETLNLAEMDEDMTYANDSFDIAGLDGEINEDGNPLLNNNYGIYLETDEDRKNVEIVVPAFGVTYGMQNQSIFKNISVNMDKPKTTDYSITRLNEISSVSETGRGTQANALAQDAYSIFANYCYSCKVEMLGCMNIMPMMYFQLNNVPLFRGAYMIHTVQHQIKAGQMTTTFIGNRVSKHTIGFNQDVFNVNSIRARVKEAVYENVTKDGTKLQTSY